MMRKKVLFSLMTAVAFGAVLIGGAYFSSRSDSEVAKSATRRTASDIEADEVVFLDDEAIAGAEDSNSNTELRSDALRAYNYVNEERAKAGADPLTWNTNLESAATVRAKEAAQSFSHTRPNGKAWNTVNSKIQGGENLAWGQTSAEQVVNEWMASPTHRDNILYDEFGAVAISLYQNDSSINYWALEFGY